MYQNHLKNNKTDLITVGAGLPNQMKDEMIALIEKITPEIELHIMYKIARMTLVSMIDYINEKAIMWRMLNVNNKN